MYNVKWERELQINKNISNESIVRFYKRPNVSITELVKPILSKTIPQVTQTGSLEGIAQIPNTGQLLSEWSAGTLYKLKIKDDSNWTSSVDENVVNIDSLNYSPTIVEVLSNKEVIVSTPFTASNGTVSDFTSSNYSTTFQDTNSQTVGESSLTGSFAQINFTNLKTFVGDVARVKVFRKSRNAVGDFQFVQESKLESTELLKDITTTTDTELSYGQFDSYNLTNYWETSSNDHVVSINTDVLFGAVKTDYDVSAGGVQTLSTSGSFTISEGVEYTLNLKTLLSGSLNDTNKSIRAYFSGSSYEQNFLTVSGSAIYRTRQKITQNILANKTVSDAHLKFDITGDDWYISNVSLRNAQDTSFSPDEFTLIQDIPRKTAAETFDFKFEFYDINNNFIPVDVSATKEFDGGNDFPTSGKLFTFESDRNAFRFTSGSIGNPIFQQIQFKTSNSNLTGSVTYASAAFDVGGTYIEPSSYTGTYPGTLTNVTPAGAIITLANFSGSDDTFTVGSIVYTASLENEEEFETVFRLEDGDNAPQLIVTSNANQFIYEPTTLSSKPSSQNITVRAQRKNLASLVTPLTVNSGSNRPPLNFVETVNGIDKYTISATEFSSSFASNAFDEVDYQFTGSDIFGNEQTDEITLSKVINFDAVSIVLSNESTSFPANSLGVVSSNFDASKGNVQMFVGGTEIPHDDAAGGRLKNTFDITSIGESNVTANSTAPTTNEYGISAFPSGSDSGSLTLNLEYLAGDNSTSQSFQKIVSYTKAKTGVPNVEIAVTPQSQTINCNSRGSGSVAPATITVQATEGGTDRFTSIGTLVFSGGISGSASTESIEFTQGASDMISDTETVTIPVNFTNSEGTTGTKNIVASFSRVKKGEPNVEVSATPLSQTLNANSLGTGSAVPATITVSALEGGTDRFTSIGDATFTGGLTGSKSTNTITFTDTVSDMESEISTIQIPINFTDGEGTTGTKTLKANITRVKSVAPVVLVSGNPQAQTVDSNADFSTVGTPSNVTLILNEGGSNYGYDTAGAIPANNFRITGVTNATNNNDGTITPDTPTDGNGTTSVATISYTNSEGSGFTGKTLTLNVGVAVQGENGATGSDGGDGKRTSANMVHYQITGSTQPSKPTATSYAFATNTFTGLTSNWGTGAPTYASGNENKYWYSTFTVVETTAGGGTGVPVFSDAVQAIGFSGLVSFTATDTIGDGTDNLSFGVAGATLINGDNISTGKIISTNYVTGSGDGYTNTGTEFNLDEGLIASKKINILPNGDANFKGDLTGASGTFSGTVQVGGTSLTSNNTLNANTTANDVSLENVENLDAQNQAQTGLIAGTTITGGGITLSSGGNIKGGQTDYNTGTGFFLGYTGSKYKFSIGSSTKNLVWDGTDLNISGSIFAESGTFSGAVNGATINVPTTSPKFTVNSAGQMTATDADLSGTISSTSGDIGGWGIATSRIFSPTSGQERMQLIGGSSPNMTLLDSSGSPNVVINSGTALSDLGGGSTTAAGSNITTQNSQNVSGFVTNGSTTTISHDWVAGPYSGLYMQNVPAGTYTVIPTVTVPAGTSNALSGLEVSTLDAGNSYIFATLTHHAKAVVYISTSASPYSSKAAMQSGAVWSGYKSYNNTQYGGNFGTEFFLPYGHGNSTDTEQLNVLGTWTNTSTSTYYFHTALMDFTATVSYAGFVDLQLETDLKTPLLAASGITVSGTVSRTEISGGGLQVVSTTSNFVKMQRYTSSQAASVVMLDVGGSIEATGNITANASDIRLKDIKGLITNPLSKLKQLNGVVFNWNNLAAELANHDMERDHVGLIAQDVEKVLPEVVTTSAIGKESGKEYLTIWYEKLVPLLVESIKELSEKVDKLEEKNKELENGN